MLLSPDDCRERLLEDSRRPELLGEVPRPELRLLALRDWPPRLEELRPLAPRAWLPRPVELRERLEDDFLGMLISG
ncbi:MAG TPA: hypothetical protein VFJ90_16290 [Candidatus Didemnitutus sp.]|nr:hypothetical protein [Candidatus Didemnitutus sp.]